MKSIRAKIMSLLFCSVLIVSLTIGTLGIILTANVIKESTTENMHLLCKNNADKIDITFAKIEESVNTLVRYAESELPNIQMLKEESYRNAFSADVQKNALHHIESIDSAAAVYMHYDTSHIGKTDGFLYVKYENSDEFKYHPLTDISASSDDANQHDWWYIPTVSGTATWFEAYYDANLDRYVISYIAPMYKDGKLIGVIGADIFSEYIVNLVKEVSIFSSGQAAILKSDGTVLYHPHFERGELIGEGDPGFAGVIEKLTKQDSTKELISYKLKDEKKKLASCKLRNGMLMVCFAPESEIYHDQNMLIIANTIITALVVLIALFIAFLVSKKLAGPIKKLNEAAKHLTDGEFDFNIRPDTNDEIGELTNTFIETRKILQQQIHLLDKEAHIDGLTGVGNKSAFVDRETEINKEISSQSIDFSVAVFDVNKLKVANDVFGHMAGDRLLLTFANYLSSVFDISNVYRTGGDEFVVILPEEENIDRKEKIASFIKGMKALSVEDYPDLKVSCAYGCSRFNKETDRQLSDILQRADKEMYKNKTETKKETYPWQEGFKGIKQLQIDKYCELLQSLKESTDDYLFLINIETGFIRFFGGDDSFFNIADGRDFSDGIAKILNYVHPNDHLLVKNATHSIINRDTEIIDINFRMRSNNNDDMRWVNCRGNVIKDETNSHFVLIGRISQNAVKHLYSPITTLFNKTKLKSDLRQDIMTKFRCLMLIDIDNLSEINLKHGSMYGDELLKTLSQELENRFSMWQIYHTEKDRFVILLDTNSSKDATNIFDQIKESLTGKCTISASVVPNDSSFYINAENIYDYAVQILNNSKKNGMGQMVFFTKESLLESISAVELLEELEESVKNKCKGFYLVYQPQINAEDYSIISAETLLRFESKTKGQVYPDQFIPILEQTGLINDVGIWIVDQALRKCKEWRKYNPNFKISVNISPKQLEKKKIASQITKLLSKYELPGDALILEITESAQLDENEDVFAVLSKFRQNGIQIAIDDFGTGYSNLGNLKHIHANILKIDRIFIKDIKENGYNYNLIYNVLEFAKSNSLTVCLEGVETKEELLVLSGLQPDIFQGYLFDKPCLPDVLETKYFTEDSPEYTKRIDYFEQLKKEKRHTPLLNMEMKTILSGLDIGLWIIRINTQTGEGELYTDGIMRQLLGVDNTITPKECYLFWQNNINPDHLPTVEATIAEMQNSDKVIQTEYLWNHPKNGEILIRCSARCTDKNDDTIVFEGFHRIIK